MDINPHRTNNYDFMCRLCLCTENNLISIFDEKYTYLPQRIAACVNVEIYKTDNISTTICRVCLSKVEDWYTFKKSCDDCQSKLRQWSSINNIICNNSLNTVIEIKEEIQSDLEDEAHILQENIIFVKEESFVEDDYNSQEPTETEYNEPDSENLSDELPYSLLVPIYEKPATIHGIDAPPCAEYGGSQNISSLTRKCRVCHKEFVNVRNRIRHERNVHYKNNEIFVNNSEISQSNLEPQISVHSDNSNTNEVESNNVTIEQFAASLQLVHNTQVKMYRTITEKHFVEFNRVLSQMLLDLNCLLCGVYYETHKSILSHLSKVLKIDKYSCFSCCIAFPNRSQYMIHMTNNYCDDRHFLLQREDNILKTYQHYQCIICGALHVHKTHLNNHLCNAHLSSNYPSACNRCDALFNTQDEYKEHLEKPCFYNIYCSICKVSYTNDEFGEHSKIHENDGTEFSFDDFVNKAYDCRLKTSNLQNDNKTLKKYSCSFCGEQFPTLDLWCEHWKIHSDNVFRCLECSRVFGTEQELQQHKSTHSTNNIKLKLYRCSDTNSYKAISEFAPSPDKSVMKENKRNIVKKKVSKYECNICKRPFARLTTLLNHKKKYHKNDHGIFKSNRRLTCRMCKKIYRNSLSYSHHKHLCIRTDTFTNEIKKEPDNFSQLNGNTNYICSLCNKSFLTERGLNVHLKNHSPKKRVEKNKEQQTDNMQHICQICKKSLPTEKGLVFHYKIHMKNHINKFECQVCQEIFSNMYLLADHFKSHSPKILQSIYNHDNSKNDVTSSSVNTKIKYVCNFCSLTFANQFSLDAHIKVHFCGSNISYKCTFCSMVTASSLELTKHVKMKHTSQINSKQVYKNNDKNHSCKICKKIFFSISNLNRHVKIHSKKYHCKKCSKRLPNLKLLKRHEEANCLYCTDCQKTFVALNEMINHVCHGNEQGVIKCASCPKIFKSKKVYINHMKMHNNKCRLCSKIFCTSKSLLTHFSTYHSNSRLKPKLTIQNSVKIKRENPFICTICSKTFTKVMALNRHMRLTHKEKRL